MFSPSKSDVFHHGYELQSTDPSPVHHVSCQLTSSIKQARGMIKKPHAAAWRTRSTSFSKVEEVSFSVRSAKDLSPLARRAGSDQASLELEREKLYVFLRLGK